MKNKELQQAIISIASIIIGCISVLMILAVNQSEDNVFFVVGGVAVALLTLSIIMQGRAISLAKKIDNDAERQAINEDFKKEMGEIRGDK
jgi:uncharacterized membrane protein